MTDELPSPTEKRSKREKSEPHQTSPSSASSAKRDKKSERKRVSFFHFFLYLKQEFFNGKCILFFLESVHFIYELRLALFENWDYSVALYNSLQKGRTVVPPNSRNF